MIGHADRFALLLSDQEAHLTTACICLMNVHEVGVCDRRWQLPGDRIQWIRWSPRDLQDSQGQTGVKNLAGGLGAEGDDFDGVSSA